MKFLLHQVIAHADAAIAIHDRDLKYLYVSDNYLKQYKVKEKDIIGKHHYEVFPDLPRKWREVHQRVLAGAVESCDEDCYVREDGSVVWTRWTCRPWYESDGVIGGLILDTEVITERKLAEAALRESEEKFRTLFEANNDAILVQDGMRIVDCNRKALEMFGCERRGEMIGKTPFDFSPPRQPDGKESLAEGVKRVQMALEGRPQNFTWQHRRPDGSRFLAEMSIHAFELQGRRLLHAIVRDVTERLRFQEELIRLNTAIEQAAEEIIIEDDQRIIRYVNPAFARLTGYSRAEAVGQKPDFLNSGVQPEALFQEIDRTTEQGQTWKGRFTSRCKDGRFVQEEATITPIKNAYGAVIGFIELKRDITEEVKLEAQLRQAQKMEAIGTLAGGIAHDFNNILSAILGYTELAIARLDRDSPVRRHLGQVFRAGERARDLVKQILAFSRCGEAERRPLLVGPIVKEVLKLLRASLPSTLAIQQEIRTGDGDTVLGDPTHIHQILMNLCTNAAQAMRDKKGTLKVSLTTAAIAAGDPAAPAGLLPGSYLKLQVSDSGVGIDPLIVNRIFDPFFTTKKPGEGTGMGLAAVYGIVSDYDGKITVDSEVGKGTAVCVYLPLLKERDVALPPKAQAVAPGGTERILLVDDEKPLVDLGREMLNPLGYEVVACTNAAEALDFFSQQPGRFDLLITDMTMPKLTGLELAAGCLKIRPGFPVILCTGFSELITAELVRAVGIREVIFKPIVKHEIAGAIRRVLDGCQ